MTPPASANPTSTRPSAAELSLASGLILAVWFGVVGGLVEGIGLLFFQRVNWERWGPMIHVSREIIWISPIVDVIFFSAVALLTALITRAISSLPAERLLIFVLSFLSLYDWFTVTGRLDRRACLILALGAAFALSRWISRRPNAMPFWRRTAPRMVLLLAVVFVGIQVGQRLHERDAVSSLPKAESGSPNVLVIVVDTLRADHVSYAGYARPTTPNLDALAQQGVAFTNAIAPCSWSLPSHVSLVTGRYLHDHGVGNVQPEPWLGWKSKSLGGFPTLGEELERRGYRTGAFSANRTYFSSDLGFRRGFIHFEDYFHSPADMFVRTLYGREFARIYLIRSDKSLVKRALRAMGATSLLDQDAEGSGSYGGAFGIRKRADVVNHEVLNWVDQDGQRPFFAFLNYFDVHDPYGGPRDYPRPAWEQRTDIDRYDDGVRYVDESFGRLMQGLEQRGMSKNTLVIVTSDHGESLGQHDLQTHGRALYRELIQVPLVIWYPGQVPAGMRIDQPVSNAAIPATVMQIVHGTSAFPGPALNQLWQSTGKTDWPEPWSELAQNRYPGKKDEAADKVIPTASSGAMTSIVTPRWHLIVHDKLGAQIFDWTRDSGETKDLIQTQEGKAAAETLLSQLSAGKKGPQ